LKCYNVQNGSIDLKVGGGGSAPYTYNWSNTNSIGGNIEDPSGLGAGTYQVTVTDPNLCKATYEVKIKEPKELLPQIVKTSTVTCDNLKNGILEVAASGGITPYTYTWSNGLQGANLDNLAAGIYKFTVTDKNGCSRNDEAQVKADTIKPKTLVVDAVSPSCRSQFGAIYIKSTNGGQPPYSYKLDSTFAGNKIFQKLLPNTYVLTVRGSNGCTNSWDVKVPTYEEPEVSLTPLDTLILPGDSVTLTATHNLNAAQLKSITWEPDVQLSCQNCNEVIVKPFAATVYTVKVKDKFDCEATASARIRFNRKVEIFVPNMLNTASDYVQNRKLGVYGSLRQVKKINLFIVHDRWGTEVYRSTEMRLNDQREGWDGLYKNQEVVPGTYVYFTEIELYNGEIVRKSGDVTVIK
jgi:large repetitive protein